MNIVLDMSSASQRARQWVPLLLNALAECGVRRGGALVPHDDVISATERLTVLFNNTIGFGASGNFSVGYYGNFVLVDVRVGTRDRSLPTLKNSQSNICSVSYE
jgi:hypothetical protein